MKYLLLKLGLNHGGNIYTIESKYYNSYYELTNNNFPRKIVDNIQLDIDTLEEYRGQIHPRFGKDNPQRVNIPFWVFMVQHPNFSPYDASRFLSLNYKRNSPYWTFKRFHHTRFILEDGTRIYIGGESGGTDDPSFYIYNDIVIINKQNQIRIYGYPPHLFPPNSNTKVERKGDILYISGGNQYRIVGGDYERLNRTKTFKLDLKTMKIVGSYTSFK